MITRPGTVAAMGVQPRTSASGSALNLPSLTSLRWLAATAVFLRHGHVLPRISVQGATGVSFFFMLSGFLLTWSERPGQRARDFLARRVARVYPAYVVATLVGIPILMAVGVLTVRRDLLPGLFTLTLLQSWVPSTAYYYGGNLVAWSLSNEAFFYLMFPLIAVPLSRLARRRPPRDLWVLLVALAAASIALPLILRPVEEGGVSFWLVYISPPFRIIEFVIGMGLAHALRRGGLPRLNLAACAALAGAAYLVAGWVPAYAMWSATTLLPFALLIVASAQTDARGDTPAVLRHPVLITLGKWSYCFYLVHSTILIGVRGVVNRLDLGVPAWGQAIGCYVVAIAAAGALHLLVEAPLERILRRRLVAPQVAHV